MKFYALISQSKDKSGVLTLESTQRLQAENKAKELCKENGFIFQEVRMVNGTGKKAGTMVKKLGDGTSTRRGRK